MTPLDVLETELSGEYMTDRQEAALTPLRALVAAAIAWHAGKWQPEDGNVLDEAIVDYILWTD